MGDTLSAAWLIARKDLAIEFRTRSAFFSAIVFALLGWSSSTTRGSNSVAVTELAPGFCGRVHVLRLLGLPALRRRGCGHAIVASSARR